MRYLILSDMHANWDAFEAVLRRARRKRFDAVLVLGDLVGYGGAPNQVVEAVRRLPRLYTVRGNHDKVVTGIDNGANFNQTALIAAQWTSSRLTPANLRFVRDLPQGPLQVEEGMAICHGSPLDEDTYVFSDVDAWEIFSGFDMPVTVFGHTHIPSVFSLEPRKPVGVRALRGRSGTLFLEPGGRYLVNPGSIGQPRDRDPRASYMTYDSERRIVRWHRVDYPIDEAQRRIRKAGLPASLADRLALGA